MNKFLITSILISPSILFLTSCKDKEEVVAAFSVDSNEIEAGVTVNFTNKSENASYYQWDFGDDEYAITESPAHTYDYAGEYIVTLVAIGDGGSSTTTDTITVTNSNATIYEGLGIEGVDLYDTWSSIKAIYGTDDTTYYSTYYSAYSYYYNIVYYSDEGLAFGFVSTSSTLSSSAEAYVIYVLWPNAGITQKGISTSSTMTEVKTAYGTPEDTYTDSDTYGYYYDSKGIDFYSYNTDYVDEMDIYEVTTTSSSATKSASPEQSVIQHVIQNRSELPQFTKGNR